MEAVRMGILALFLSFGLHTQSFTNMAFTIDFSQTPFMRIRKFLSIANLRSVIRNDFDFIKCSFEMII
jgi:hypothetical protein